LVHCWIRKIVVGTIDGPKLNLILRQTRRPRMATAMMTEKRLQAIEVDLMGAVKKVEISERGFLHGDAPVLLFASCFVPLQNFIF
jgi:hypothetical protein